MATRIEMIGKNYGHLTVCGLAEKVKGVRARLWVADCAACRGKGEFAGSMLRAGAVTSCGCLPALNVKGFKLVESMKKTGQRLCKSLPDNTLAADVTRFFLEPSGKLVRPDIAEAAISAQALVALSDGLFVGTTQTFVVPA